MILFKQLSVPNERSMIPGTPYEEIRCDGDNDNLNDYEENYNPEGFGWEHYSLKTPLAWEITTGKSTIVHQAPDNFYPYKEYEVDNDPTPLWRDYLPFVNSNSSVPHDIEVRSSLSGPGNWLFFDGNNLGDTPDPFYKNETPIYFISATNFNLLGADEWIKGFKFICHIECFDGLHPNVFSPTEEIPHDDFEGIEDINNYLLQHPEVQDYLKTRAPGKKAGKAMFLMFDEKTEKLAKQQGLEIMFPSAKMRTFMDNKVNTNRIADKAGVPCVPNVLTKVKSYSHLQEVSKDLGNDLVIQTPFGDSGHTTFFISNEEEFKKHEEEIIKEKEVNKVNLDPNFEFADTNMENNSFPKTEQVSEFDSFKENNTLLVLSGLEKRMFKKLSKIGFIEKKGSVAGHSQRKNYYFPFFYAYPIRYA